MPSLEERPRSGEPCDSDPGAGSWSNSRLAVRGCDESQLARRRQGRAMIAPRSRHVQATSTHEFVLIFVIALLVFGPRSCPDWAPRRQGPAGVQEDLRRDQAASRRSEASKLKDIRRGRPGRRPQVDVTDLLLRIAEVKTKSKRTSRHMRARRRAKDHLTRITLLDVCGTCESSSLLLRRLVHQVRPSSIFSRRSSTPSWPAGDPVSAPRAPSWPSPP